MAKIPNQTNINEVIRAQVESVADVVNVIVTSAITKRVVYSTQTLKDLQNFTNVINAVFGKDGVGTTILNISSKINSVVRNGVSSKPFKQLFGVVRDMHMYLNQISSLMQVQMKPNVDFSGISTVMKQLESVLSVVDGKKYKGLWLKFAMLKRDIGKVVEFANYLGNLNIDKNTIDKAKKPMTSLSGVFALLNDVFASITKITPSATISLKIMLIKYNLVQLENLLRFISVLNLLVVRTVGSMASLKQLLIVTNMLNNVFMNIESIELGVSTYVKLKLIPGILMRFIKVLRVVDIVAAYIRKMGGLKDSLILATVFNMIESVFTSIHTMRVGLFIRIKLNRINRSLLMMNKILTTINLLKVSVKQVAKLALLQLVFSSLTAVFLTITLASPILLLAVPAMGVLLAATFLLKLTMGVVVELLSRMASKNAVKGMLALIVIGGLFSMVAITFLGIALVAKPVVQSSLWILGLLGVITAVVVLTSLLGLGMVALAPLFLPIIAGLGLMALVVVALGVVAITLRVLQSISLDREKITENVSIVLDTAKMVVGSIFGTDDDDKDVSGSKHGWIASIIKFVGGPIANVLGAIMAVSFLATIVAAVSMVLLISAQLRLIQALDLDGKKIQKNVGVVMSAAKNVVDSIFNDIPVETKESDKNWIVDLLSKFGGNVGTVIKAVMSVGYLSMVFASISFVGLIATQLRLIQNLDLNGAKVSENVGMVMSVATGIVNSIFGKNESESKGSSKSWIVSLLEMVGGPIVKVTQAIMSVGYLASTMGAIFMVKLLANQLKTISDINLPSDITPKVDSIFIAADQLINSFINRKDTLQAANPDEKKKGFLKKMFGNIGDGIEMVASMGWVSTAMVAVGMVSQIAEKLTTIKETPDLNGISVKVDQICATADNIIKKINETPDWDIADTGKLDVLEQINSRITQLAAITPQQVKGIEKTIDNYVRFVDKINTVDVAKLETSARMFEQMSKFSSSIKGDFDALAESLGDKLLPVLTELKEVMETVPTKLDIGFQNTSASIAATTAPVNTANVTAQVERENPTMSKEDVDKIVQSRIKDYSRQESNGVVAKIDELISLLKGHNGDVVVRTV